MNNAEKSIEAFYMSFQKNDWKGMQQQYHHEVMFSDPVFQSLKGGEAKAMWHMLAIAAKDLIVNFKNIKSDGTFGSADWDAVYSFSKTGRKVHNIIHAKFVFQDGKIIRHTDSFNLWKWASMALGVSGSLLGWTPNVQLKIREGAKKNLDKFIAEHPEYRS